MGHPDMMGRAFNSWLSVHLQKKKPIVEETEALPPPEASKFKQA
jgi:hypothetical protein